MTVSFMKNVHPIEIAMATKVVCVIRAKRLVTFEEQILNNRTIMFLGGRSSPDPVQSKATCALLKASSGV